MNQQPFVKDVPIELAFDQVRREMIFQGYRQRTIDDYEYHLRRMCQENQIESTLDLSRKALLRYMNSGKVNNTTRSIRLKSIRSLCKKFYNNNWIKKPFWEDIEVFVDVEVKEGATEEDLVTLISQLDFNNFVEFRDACAFLLMWENGIRLNTLSQLTIDMIDEESLTITYPSYTMKGRRTHTLPISKDLMDMLLNLYKKNQRLFPDTDKIFIASTNPSSDFGELFSRRIRTYKKNFRLKNINAHAIRRGFAKRLLDKGVSVPVISKALGHKSIDTTTRYLYISNQEVIDSLREIV